MRNTFAGVRRRLGATRLVSRAARLLLTAAMLVCSLDAAAMRLIDPGEDPKLAEGEGLVVLSVDVSAPVSAVRIGEVGGGTAKVISAMRYGRNVRLYAAKAGEYRWTEVDVFTWYTRVRYTLRSEDYRFKVVPGKIIYPGDLILRPSSWSYINIHVANHSLPVIDWLETQHAALYKQLPFQYQGLYPDPFPAYYRTARAGNTQAPDQLNGGREPPKPGTLPLPVDLLWKPNRVAAVSLNPAGDLLAETVRDGTDKWAIDLIDLKSGTSERLGSSSSPAYLLMWKDDRTLIAAPGSGRQEHVVYRIGDSDGSRHKVERLRIEGTGRVVDLMPTAPDMILFEGFDSRGKLAVHLVALSGKKTISGFASAKSRDRLNTGVENDLGWYADGHGRLRVAMASRDETLVLMHGKNGVFNEVWRPKAEGGFEPAGLSFDGETIYGYTDDERSQRDLVAFDPATRKVTRTLFTKPGVDVVGMVFDHRREPVAARYYESGRLVTEYFDSASQQTAAATAGGVSRPRRFGHRPQSRWRAVDPVGRCQRPSAAVVPLRRHQQARRTAGRHRSLVVRQDLRPGARRHGQGQRRPAHRSLPHVAARHWQASAGGVPARRARGRQGRHAFQSRRPVPGLAGLRRAAGQLPRLGGLRQGVPRRRTRQLRSHDRRRHRRRPARSTGRASAGRQAHVHDGRQLRRLLRAGVGDALARPLPLRGVDVRHQRSRAVVHLQRLHARRRVAQGAGAPDGQPEHRPGADAGTCRRCTTRASSTCR